MTFGAIVMTVSHAGLTRGGAVYDVTLDGEMICSRSKDPEHESVRALVAAGVSQDEFVAFSRSGAVSMTGRLGWFAGHRTTEGVDSPPKTIGWTPYFGQENRAEE